MGKALGLFQCLMWEFGKRDAGAVLVITVVAIATGPFDTFDTLALPVRALYWTVAIVGISAIMIATVHGLLPRVWPESKGVRAFYVGTALGSPVAAIWLMTLDVVVRGEVFTLSGVFVRFYVIVLITMMIGLVKGHVRWEWVERMFRHAPPAEAPIETPSDDMPAAEPVPLPVFFRNLGPDLGPELISISTQDHYLDVVTSKGRDRILKRMSDALVELDGYPGLQVHRSHWVALDAVERLEKDGRKARVVMKNGDALPVSRPNLPLLVDALEER